ncbi:hypothetical protein BWI97_06295 [Siphonobacter sp. BAB-5405]|uniref:porin family protein n=1 Tax=Siphonobacter sp. BAB-5405 TaxID=1864825 RepID=UPI000C7FF204|nr:porin family protein [Siphonobacter sp. BAB-5405]PMD98290.1 hypothetical protein BWI97_06295 [Siphonobacter sp. BAB-5405]
MKKYLLLCSFLCLSAASTFAQRDKPWFQLGIKAGTNLSQLKTGNFVANGSYSGSTLRENLKQSLDTRTGFVGGIYMRFGRTLYIQPEVLYTGKGGSYLVQPIDANGQAVGSPTQVKVKTENIDVPVLLGLKFGPLRVNAGPVASFLIGSNESIKEAITKYTQGSVSDTFNQAAWGYQLGGGLDIGNFSLDVRYEDSLSNVRFVNISTPNGSDPFKQKSKNWQVTLGMKVF